MASVCLRQGTLPHFHLPPFSSGCQRLATWQPRTHLRKFLARPGLGIRCDLASRHHQPAAESSTSTNGALSRAGIRLGRGNLEEDERLEFEQELVDSVNPGLQVVELNRVGRGPKGSSQSRNGKGLPWPLQLGILAAGVGVCFACWRVAHSGGGRVVALPETATEVTVDNGGLFQRRKVEEQRESISQGQRLLGHLKVEEAPDSDLVSVGPASDGVLLRTAAAKAFEQMRKRAHKDGVSLRPISGYRSVETQRYIFFEEKARRNQDALERAKVVAPPGYSEHHTGYVLDIGDGRARHTDLEESFEQTAASHWLRENAKRFHFEMSFPRNNKYGIMYEPWHWRFVGDDHSLMIFHGHSSLNS